MLITILDTETTGVSPDTDRVIEIATVTYDTVEAAVVDVWSSLVAPDVEVTEGVHGIPPALVGQYGAVDVPPIRAPFILAHNAPFDRDLCAASGIEVSGQWVDTQLVRWPRAGQSRRLVDLALAHGVPVVSAHRAVWDCLILAQLLTRAAELGLDLDAEIARAGGPVAEFEALCSFEDRVLARDAGAYWDGERKKWIRRCLVADAESLPVVGGRLSWRRLVAAGGV